MKTFRQFSEEWKRGHKDSYSQTLNHHFKVDGHDVQVSFDKDADGKETLIDFEVNHTMHKTKKSPVSPKILHHVNKVIKHYLSKKHREGTFYMSPNSATKKKIYHQYANRLAKQLGGKSGTKDDPPIIILKKKKNK